MKSCSLQTIMYIRISANIGNVLYITESSKKQKITQYGKRLE